MTSPHGPYGVGYRRATRRLTMCRNIEKWSQSLKKSYYTNCMLELAYMKQEFRVIVDHHATVKLNLTDVLTARHGRRDL